VIGKDDRLPWHLPADLKFFKNSTLNHSLIGGRRTYDSIDGPLPKRRNILLTRQADPAYPGVELAHSIPEALALCEGEERVFILGGEDIFRQCMEQGYAHELLLTRVHTTAYEGDTYFPRFSEEAWQRVWQEFRSADERNPHDMTFERWVRR
jgi:dihydrofolate reductase